MYDFLYKISDAVGMFGVILILIAYYYLSIGQWNAKRIIFQSYNFIGAWLILYSLYFHWNTASVTIEIAWIIISMVGMCRILGFIPGKD